MRKQRIKETEEDGEEEGARQKKRERLLGDVRNMTQKEEKTGEEEQIGKRRRGEKEKK